MKNFQTKVLRMVLLVLGGAVVNANAADAFNVKINPPELPTLRQGEGYDEDMPAAAWSPAKVRVCTMMNVQTCKAAVLPKQTGHVKNIVRGNWVAPAAASASWIAFTSRHATLCYMHSQSAQLGCIPILAYTPADADVEYRDMGSGLKALVFTQRPGAKQPLPDYYRSVQIFTRALDTARQEAQNHARSTYRADLIARAGLGGNASMVYKMDGDQLPGPDLTYDCGNCTETGGGYESGNWETWDFTTDYWEYDSGSWEPASAEKGTNDGWFPQVVIGPPDAEPEAKQSFFPEFAWTWPYQVRVEPDLPPSTDWPATVTVSNTTTCTFSGLIVVCTAPRPAPIPVNPEAQPLPPQRQWNPSIPTWNFCDTFGIFCSVEDNDRGENSNHDGKTAEELAAICFQNLETEDKLCDAQQAMGADSRTVRACHERAAARYAACLTTARATGRK